MAPRNLLKTYLTFFSTTSTSHRTQATTIRCATFPPVTSWIGPIQQPARRSRSQIRLISAADRPWDRQWDRVAGLHPGPANRGGPTVHERHATSYTYPRRRLG